MAMIITYHLTITLNVNSFNSLIKRYNKPIKWIKNQNPPISCLQDTPSSFKERHAFRVQGWTTVLQSNGTREQEGVAILISEKTLQTNKNQSEEI